MKTPTSTRLVTAARMRAVEQAAIETGRVTGRDLMEHAGRAVIDAIFAQWPALAQVPGRAIILCGPGNNGGDGFVIARLLRGWGWRVEVFALGDPDRLPPDAAANRALWGRLGPTGALPLTAPPELQGGTGVIIDALFGTGLTRGLGGALMRGVLAPFDTAEFDAWHRVAVDIPSGLCADSGRVLCDAEGHRAVFRADLTVCFHRRKPGHVLGDGPDICGRVVVSDIGLGQDDQHGDLYLAAAPAPADILKRDGHKYDHGHALVLSGGQGRSGAARLAARAALRIGAGLVSVAAPPEAMAECAAQLTAIMLRPLADTTAFAAILEDRRLNAICLGPGLGLGPAHDLVPVALAARRATVLDADALGAFAHQPEALFAALHADVVLTPHDGEFARLFPDLAARLAAPAKAGPAYSRVDAVRAAAARAGCVVLLKGRDTVIADPAGVCIVHAATGARSVPYLATAGAGDVLAGFITGLMARGMPARGAAAAAAWLHVEVARRFGPGLIAEDLPEGLPEVLRALIAAEAV